MGGRKSSLNFERQKSPIVSRITNPVAPLREKTTDIFSVTQRAAAAIHGVSTRTIRRWLALGLPRNADGTFDVPATIAWRVQHRLDRFLALRRPWWL